jgi:hypothetical protein
MPCFVAVPSRSGVGPLPVAASSRSSVGPAGEFVGEIGTSGRYPGVAVPKTRARTLRSTGGGLSSGQLEVGHDLAALGGEDQKSADCAGSRGGAIGNGSGGSFRCKRKVQPQRDRHRQNPLARRPVGDHFVHEMRRELGHPPSSTRRAEPAPLAREGHEQVERTARTAHTTEAVRDISTGDDGAQLALDICRQRTSAVLVREATQESLEMRA